MTIQPGSGLLTLLTGLVVVNVYSPLVRNEHLELLKLLCIQSVTIRAILFWWRP